jgi:hypothetical protein
MGVQIHEPWSYEQTGRVNSARAWRHSEMRRNFSNETVAQHHIHNCVNVVHGIDDTPAADVDRRGCARARIAYRGSRLNRDHSAYL